MDLEKNFFNQFLKIISSNNEIISTLEKLFEVFAKHFPIYGMSLVTATKDLAETRIIHFDISKKSPIIDSFQLNTDRLTASENLYRELFKQATTIKISKETIQSNKDIQSLFLQLPKNDVIICQNKIANEPYGFLQLFLNESAIFTQEQSRLIEMIHLPMAYMLNNSFRFSEIQHLRSQLKQEKVQRLHYQSKFNTDIVGIDGGLKKVYEKVYAAASTNIPILITGETGSGKEVIARLAHHLSNRSSNSLLTVNCGAIPINLSESELFGHEKGSFTGAVQLRKGHFENAHKSTIFLDEISELPLEVQVKLLRVIQEGEITRIGSSKTISVDVRIIAASNRDLAQMVKEGSFRKDLFYRLNVFSVHILPLRERKNDIPALIAYYIKKKYLDFGFISIPHISPDDLDKLCNYPWYGNVRELFNTLETAMVISQKDKLNFDFLVAQNQELTELNPKTFLSLDEVMKKHIEDAFKLSKGQLSGENGAATLLKIHHNTLSHRMKKLGINIKKI